MLVPVGVRPLLDQMGLAVIFYVGVLVIVRLAGKRLAGQTTTFDLVVLISLIVALQKPTVRDGVTNTIVFIAVVLALHRGLAALTARYTRLKRLIRGAPRDLVVDGRVIREALVSEGVGHDELMAGLRKLGYESPTDVKVAVLEETGHISAVARDK